MAVNISFFHTHSVEKWKISPHRKRKFRQINYLLISLVRPSLSRNFCQQSVRVNFRRVTMWKLRKFTFTLFWQKCRENNAFTKWITKELIWRKIFFFIFPHCACDTVFLYLIFNQIFWKFLWKQRFYYIVDLTTFGKSQFSIFHIVQCTEMWK